MLRRSSRDALSITNNVFPSVRRPTPYTHHLTRSDLHRAETKFILGLRQDDRCGACPPHCRRVHPQGPLWWRSRGPIPLQIAEDRVGNAHYWWVTRSPTGLCYGIGGLQ